MSDVRPTRGVASSGGTSPYPVAPDTFRSDMMKENGTNNRPHVLVADDQADVLEALRLLLKGHGYDIETASSPAAVLAILEKRDFDALLLDMNYTRDTTSGREGLDLL